MAEKLDSHVDQLSETTPTGCGERNAPKVPDAESYRTQLVELNNRSRWYSTQRWVVPLAYVATTSNALFQLKTDASLLALAYIAAGLVAIPILAHLRAVDKAVKRAVVNIQKTEDALGLPQTAKYKAEMVTEPLELLVLITGFVYFIIGCVLLNVC